MSCHERNRQVAASLCQQTLWDEEGLASRYSCIDEPASCGVGPIYILFNEPKQHVTCSMYPSYVTHETGWWLLGNTDAHANECVLKAF